MEVKKVFPSTFKQTSGRVYAKWNNLNNLTNDEFSKYAETDLIRGNSLTPHTPAKLTLTNFKCNLPNGARVKEIRTKHRLNKAHYQDYSKCCDLGNVKVSITGLPNQRESVDIGFNYNSNMRTHYWQNCDYDASVVNSENFGMEMIFPKNRNNIRGYGRLRVAYLEVYYELPEYELTLNKISGEYKDDIFEVSATISNKTDTTHIPSVELTIPQGFILEDYSTKGKVTQTEGKIYWNPGLNRISSDTLSMKFSIDYDFGVNDSYTGTFSIFEDYTQLSKSLNVTVLRYYSHDVSVEYYGDYAVQNEEYTYIVSFTDEELAEILNESDTDHVEFRWLDLNSAVHLVSVNRSEWPSNNEYPVVMTPTTLGTFPIKVTFRDDSNFDHYFKFKEIDVVPNDEDSKNVGLLLLPLSEEELNRLGDGVVYTAQTWLRTHYNDDSSRVRDWKYNFRLGVFNEAISENITVYEYLNENGEIEEIVVDTTDYENLTIDEIIENTIWSEAPTTNSGFNNLTCNFRYNSDYPLYIIVTGDNRALPTNSQKSPRFTEPVVSETAFYKGDEPNGIFPVPILNTLSNTGQSEMIIPSLSSANTLVFSDFDIDINPEEYVIRGAMLSGDCKGDNIAISSKLINQGNETRVKSIVLDDRQDFTLGGYGDNWGFKTEDIKNFNDWEIHLTSSNTILNDELYFYLNNMQLTLFVEKLEELPFKTFIDGEDLAYYGVFVTDLVIPEGLKTDTSYLKVNGSDFNDPYLQSIREKEIEIEFDLSVNCDIKGNATALRQLTKLLVNERDKYNRPIPKKICFSHHEDVYWEYILEEGYTPELNISTYTVKTKLTVPAGTAYTKQDTLTTNQGYVDGLVHVNPMILLKPTNELISISDLESKQVFNIGYSDYAGKSMKIDCLNRKVYLVDDTTSHVKDITNYVDMNSDWFKLLGFFNLRCTGAIIQTVSFKERW